MHGSTSSVRRACAVGTTIALIGLSAGLGVFGVATASADTLDGTTTNQVDGTTPATDAGTTGQAGSTPAGTDTTTDPSTPSDSSGATTGTDAGSTTDPAGSGTPGTDATGTDPSGSGSATGSTNGATPDGTPVTIQDAPVNDATTVTLTGKATVGSTLTATPAGFTGTTYTFTWSRGADVVSTGSLATYAVTDADTGKVISVTVVSDAITDAAATTSTPAAVSQDPTFPEKTSYDEPLTLTTVAGQDFSHAFVADGTPAATYSLGWYDDGDAEPATDADPADGDTSTPSDQLPDHTVFAEDGMLVGAPTEAGYYDFAVIASNGGTDAVEYVELEVKPAASVGVLVVAIDDASLSDSHVKGWIVEPNGATTTVELTAKGDPESDDYTVDERYVTGGTPTVQQGGSLLVLGGRVDTYGNDVDGWSDEDVPVTVITSDIASDVVTWDEDEFSAKVTFPHASTHHLTVTIADDATTFAVRVQPVATTVSAVTPPRASGTLAYTGSDDSALIGWAAGLLAAGAVVTGLRIARRRTQR